MNMILPSRLLLTRVWCHLIKNICSLLRATKWEILNICRVLYSGIARSFTTCRNDVIYVLFTHIITHTEQIILRDTIINNSLRGLRFLFRMLRTRTIFILGCSTKLRVLFARLIAIYSSWKVYSMFPPTYISCDYCCVTFVSLFINLRHPRDFTSHTYRRGTLYIYIRENHEVESNLRPTSRSTFLILSRFCSRSCTQEDR